MALHSSARFLLRSFLLSLTAIPLAYSTAQAEPIRFCTERLMKEAGFTSTQKAEVAAFCSEDASRDFTECTIDISKATKTLKVSFPASKAAGICQEARQTAMEYAGDTTFFRSCVITKAKAVENLVQPGEAVVLLQQNDIPESCQKNLEKKLRSAVKDSPEVPPSRSLKSDSEPHPAGGDGPRSSGNSGNRAH